MNERRAGRQAPGTAPAVSVILPLYRSEATLGGCLAALRAQSWRDFEVIMVDSSADASCRPIAADYPEFRYVHAQRRLLPQEARGVGIAEARAPLFAFSDPDCYAAADWLEHLLATYRARSGVVVGALACHGDRWLDGGIHFCKFSKWLPGGGVRPVDMGPTANLLCPRDLFERCGGFGGDSLLGDTTLSWELRRRGVTLWFDPGAVVAHHHLDTFRGFLRERRQRGRLFGRLRLEWSGTRRSRAAALGLASIAGPRLLSNLFHCLRHARAAGLLLESTGALPIVVSGYVASLGGEALACWDYVSAAGRERRKALAGS